MDEQQIIDIAIRHGLYNARSRASQNDIIDFVNNIIAIHDVRLLQKLQESELTWGKVIELIENEGYGGFVVLEKDDSNSELVMSDDIRKFIRNKE